MRVLVTGGAGFIGSVVVETLVSEGFSVIAIDDLRYGHRGSIPEPVKFYEGDICDRSFLESVFSQEPIDAVVHLAAEAYIDESIVDPGRFYLVNVQGGINLLEEMKQHSISRIVFSSTAAIFGEPNEIPVTEKANKIPVNAYGETKLTFERALAWYHRSFGVKHVSFRYFNACGATRLNGEDRSKETHLIPILFQVAQGKRQTFNLFGTDYPTRDGTCVRDYVHVSDIANAHVLALKKIDELVEDAFNLGSGTGNTNLEVIEQARKITGHAIPFTASERRPGDPAILVAASTRAEQVLGWKPTYSSLNEMISSAWAWRSSNPGGYSA